MSTVWNEFKEFLLSPGQFKKLFRNHNAGQRILPSNTNKNNTQHQLRIDAGEVKDGKKNIYHQINSEAKNSALKKYRSKNGTHANVATAQISVDIPEEERADEAERVAAALEKDFKSKIG